jgi:Alg9-like mannosyltransferase family
VRFVALVVDVVLIAAIAAGLAIACGWAGTFHAGPWMVKATSAHNPIAIAAAALVIRSLAPEAPFLAVVPILALPRRALHGWHRVHDGLLGLGGHRATQCLFAIMAASLVLKLALAYLHPGFWTGDDVEIHEMTFARLFGHSWLAWNIRSPFYPLGFIYPFQALVAAAGYADPASLVLAGRSVVATFTVATLWLTFHVARRVFASVPVALLSVLILATNKLHVATGTTELPRPVAAFFVLAAFWLLTASRRDAAACIAGSLIGVAAAMRFSEEVFLVPAVLQMCAARRWRAVLMISVGFAVVALTTLGAIDAVYWGQPFHSLTNVVDFTLTRRLSTRGFQPWYEYVRAIPSWTNAAAIALAIYGAVSLRLWAVAGWACVPMLMLSILPHKEPRYLVPILPFFAMLVSAGLWQAIVWVSTSAPTIDDRLRERAALILAAAVLAVLMTEPTEYVLPRGDDGIAIARYIAANGATDGVVAEEAWNIGGRIYLSEANPLLDIDASNLRDRARLATIIRTPGVKWLVLQEEHLRGSDCESTIAAAGFDRVVLPGASAYRVYRRRGPIA